jgi:ArsR family transcriptional regulator, nickel/cobalt-responsive transcriptional repressor
MTPARPRREGRAPRVSDPPAGEPPAGEPPVSEAEAERLADTMFALSTPSRVLILACLLGGPRSVSDLTDALGMEQSAVSHQLRVLREHDLVRAEKDGRKRLYALSDEHVSTLLRAAFHHVGVPDPAGAQSAHETFTTA